MKKLIITPLTGIILVLLSSVAFSSKAIMVKLSYAYAIDAASLIALRMLFSIPLFLVLAMWVLRKQPSIKLTSRELAQLMFLSLLGGYGSMWLNFEGLRFVSAGLERVILFLYPTLVLVISAILYRRKILRIEWIALVLSYVGVVLVVWHDIHLPVMREAHTLYGSTLVFGSALVYAVYLIASGRLIPKMGALLFTCYTMTLATVASLGHYGITHTMTDLLTFPSQVYWLAGGMAVIATVFPSVLMNLGIQALGSQQASMISSIGPVSTIVLAYVFLGEQVSLMQGFGTALVLAGVVLVSILASEKPH